MLGSTIRHRIKRAGALLALFCMPVLLFAVSERHFFEIEHDRETEFEVEVDIALGSVSIGKADPGYLFQAEVILENSKLKPEFDYDVHRGTGRLKVDLGTVKEEDDVVSLPDVKKSRWELYFGDEVPIDLELQLGATSSDLDMSGLPIRRLDLEFEASRGRIYFLEPNPIAMEELDIESGASDLELSGLGNARARTINFDGGMGKFQIDLTGDGPLIPGSEANIDVGMASLRVTLPDDGQVILYVPDSWLCSVDIPDGYVKHRPGVYHSPSFESEEEALTVNVDAAVGKVAFVTRRRS